ncbi:MAG: Uma2 family endonuclease [Chloroflexi bacterium]|nr:Uma2 family endonuclease [Chloroflexota bacterium]MCC6897297.1 Uma2 family endonuclease [Anaerolineae bacterium]
MLVAKKLYTFDEFEAYMSQPQNTDRLFELINGEIVEKVPTQEHGVIMVNIAADFKMYSRQNNFGRVGAEVLHRMTTDNYNGRQPDVSFYIDTTEPISKKGAVPRMPDVAVEIQSPRDSIKKLREKADYMLANGTRMVWLVYPAKQLIEVVTLDDVEFYTMDDTISGEPVLPGFTMKVRDVFEG